MKPFSDNGLILCTVIDSDDPEGLGNIRVEFPDFANQPSTWAPVSTMMASGGAGTWFRPKPGDQVLVGFERGDPKFPIVIGSIWSNADQPPPDDGNPGENNWQQIVSRSGAILRFDDTPGAEKVELFDSSGGLTVSLDTAAGQLSVSAEGDVQVEATGTLRLSAQNIEISAGGSISIAADSGSVTVSGTTIELN
ncbi:MAG: phage baseplate assembly protein V [Pseudomonadota bacterium]